MADINVGPAGGQGTFLTKFVILTDVPETSPIWENHFKGQEKIHERKMNLIEINDDFGRLD